MFGKRVISFGLILCLFFIPLPSAADEMSYRELFWEGGFSPSDFLPGSGANFYDTWKLSPYGGSLTVSARLPNQSFGWWATPYISLSRYKDGVLTPVAGVELAPGGETPRDLILPPTSFDYDLMNDSCAAFVVSFYPASSCSLYWCWYDVASFTVKRPGDCTVQFELTYPVGKSPKVFTEGWTFGARAIRALPDGSYEGLSSKVKWSGTGKFYPETGSRSSPAFNGAGTNTITLSLEAGGAYSKSFTVEAVSPEGYARLSDYALAPADRHGCIACAHSVEGPILIGSPNVLIQGLPAARAGDPGVHGACCAANTFEILAGDESVLIDGRPAARIGDPTQHCGGMGSITGRTGTAPAANGARAALAASAPTSVRVPLDALGGLSGLVSDPRGIPIPGLRVWLFGPHGTGPKAAETGADGRYAFTGLPDGNYRVYFSNETLREEEGQLRVSFVPYYPKWYYERGSYNEAALVAVSAGTPAANIDTQMWDAGSISGRLTDNSGLPVEKARVTAYRDGSFALSWHWTDADGRYEITGLPDGSYRLWIEDSDSRFVPSWYPGSPSRDAAKAVTVSGAGRVGGIDAVLAPGGTISGKVTDLKSGTPLAGVRVQAAAPEGAAGGIAETDAAGIYRITGLADGFYKVRFISEELGYAGLWYAGRKSWDSAEKITIASAGEVGGIDAALDKMTLQDLLSLLQILSRMPPSETIYHIRDLDGDAKIGLAEVIHILQKVAEVR